MHLLRGVEVPALLLYARLFGYDRSASHFHSVYPRVRNWIRTRAGPGDVVFVGAGVLGKMYCTDARRVGAVGLDAGSALDYICGFETRALSKAYSGWLSGPAGSSVRSDPAGA